MIGLTVVASPADPGPIVRHHPVGWGGSAELLTRMGSNGVLFAPGIRYGPPAEGLERAEAYRWDPSIGRLEAVSKTDWDGAAGDIVECERAGLTPKVFVYGGRLQADGRTIELPAEARDARLDPSGRRISVLLGWGYRYNAPSIAPGFGGPKLLGFREHVFVRRDDGIVFGKRHTIRFGTRDPRICWTPDGQHVVLYDLMFREVTIVPAPKL